MFNNKFKFDAAADIAKSILEADAKAKMEALKGDQEKLDKNRNGKLDAQDFKILRGEKKVNEAEANYQSSYRVGKTANFKPKASDVGQGRKITGKMGKYGKQPDDDNMVEPPPEHKVGDVKTDPSAVVPGHSTMGAKLHLASLPRDSEGNPVVKGARRVNAADLVAKRKAMMAGQKNEEVEEELEEAFIRTPGHIKKHLEDLYGTAQTTITGKDTVQHITRHLNDDGEDADEVRTHELIGKGKDSKVGKLIKHTKPPKEFFEEVEEMEEASNLALRGLFSTDPKRAGQFLSTQKGKENRAKKNVPELKSAIKRQLGRHPKPNLPEEYVEEAIEDTLHPAGAALLKHIKPEHHNLYKPHLTKDVFNGSYGDRTSVLKAAKDAGHLKMDLKKQNEEVGELDELDTGTLKQYAKKAMNKTMSSAKKGDMETSNKRSSGLTKAIDRLNKREPLDSGKSMKSVMKNWHKEDVESLEERTLTSDETAAKEKIVHGMKKSLKGFKARYGDRAKEVMYATATKQAKKD